jgi:hypothetical protein
MSRYSLPLSERLRYARDPNYRLACINASRARRGAPPIASLSDMGNPRDGRRGAPRDQQGRFQ